eukprot:scaffold162906_cov36-Tisochrysis_lutea.AAC.4
MGAPKGAKAGARKWLSDSLRFIASANAMLKPPSPHFPAWPVVVHTDQTPETENKGMKGVAEGSECLGLGRWLVVAPWVR